MNKSPLLKKAGTQKLLASLLSILIGLFFGSLLVLIVGLTTSNIGGKGAWDGIRLIFIGLFSKSRDAAGNLSVFVSQITGCLTKLESRVPVGIQCRHLVCKQFRDKPGNSFVELVLKVHELPHHGFVRDLLNLDRHK